MDTEQQERQDFAEELKKTTKKTAEHIKTTLEGAKKIYDLGKKAIGFGKRAVGFIKNVALPAIQAGLQMGFAAASSGLSIVASAAKNLAFSAIKKIGGSLFKGLFNFAARPRGRPVDKTSFIQKHKIALAVAVLILMVVLLPIFPVIMMVLTASSSFSTSPPVPEL